MTRTRNSEHITPVLRTLYWLPVRHDWDKTELLVIGPKHKVNPPIKGIHVAGAYTEVSNNARNIGVSFDSHVNLEKHATNTCKTALYHLRNIAKIRNCLSQRQFYFI